MFWPTRKKIRELIFESSKFEYVERAADRADDTAHRLVGTVTAQQGVIKDLLKRVKKLETGSDVAVTEHDEFVELRIPRTHKGAVAVHESNGDVRWAVVDGALKDKQTNDNNGDKA